MRVPSPAQANQLQRSEPFTADDRIGIKVVPGVTTGIDRQQLGGHGIRQRHHRTHIHDRGLVTLILQHHDAIDALVAEAYGWPAALSDEDILTRLVALNKERAAEEARGLVRYLRPEFQDPGYRAPIATSFDLGEADMAPVSNVIPWPATLPEQVGAVQSVLAAAPTPLGAEEIARSFKGKRAATVRPVLDALAGLGMARRLEDGRYAA